MGETGKTASERLIQTLQNPKLFDHPITQFQVIETHLSWVLLTGLYAYKIKKPLDLGFADFSTLEKRKFYCLEELKLNQRLAQNLYVTVIPITGTVENPHLNEHNKLNRHIRHIRQAEAIEYAVKMHQFEQTNLLTNLAKQKKLTFAMLSDIATQIAHFHSTARPSPTHSVWGSPPVIWQAVSDNFTEIRKHIQDNALLKKISELESWITDEFEKLKPLILKRKEKDFIKECHGDLHLANMVFLNNSVTIFDCIEFNEGFRFIDVIDEVAFLTMDLSVKTEDYAAFWFLNAYLEKRGDYEGIPLLRFYRIYRALVRAKIILLTKPLLLEDFIAQIEWSLKIIKPSPPKLIITHGIPGTGKTFITRHLAPYLSAIYCRSDKERERVFSNMTTMTNMSNMGEKERYSDLNIDANYQRLLQLATLLLEAGYSVIVDATFIKQKHRTLFKKLADAFNIPFIILDCKANRDVLVSRVKNRSAKKEDASEATIEILNQLLKKADDLTIEEQTFTITLKTDTPIDFEILAREDIFR